MKHRSSTAVTVLVGSLPLPQPVPLPKPAPRKSRHDAGGTKASTVNPLRVWAVTHVESPAAAVGLRVISRVDDNTFPDAPSATACRRFVVGDASVEPAAAASDTRTGSDAIALSPGPPPIADRGGVAFAATPSRRKM